MAMRDSQLFFRNTTVSLTETFTSSALTINGTPAGGLACVIDIPKQSAGDLFAPVLKHSTDDSTYTTLLTFESYASVTVAHTTPKQLVRRFHTRNKYVKLEITVAGTSPDFGAVYAAIEADTQWNVLGIGNPTTNQPS